GLPDRRGREAAPRRSRGGSGRARGARMSGATERAAGSAPFDLAELLAATGGDLVALGGRTSFDGVATDTRGLRAGEVFVAARGARPAGHASRGGAARAGRGGVIVARHALAAGPGCSVVLVRDTLTALGDLAAFHRRRMAPRVLAVTGSNGKTTTKEMLA